MSDVTDRVYNFSPGPAAIPLSVLKQVQSDLICYPGAGASVLEISHRSAAFDEILEETELNLRQLLDIPAEYKVLFLQGGAQLQFSMLPMNLLRPKQVGAYVVTGTWGRKASREAEKEGDVSVVWSDEAGGFTRVPGDDEIEIPDNAAYVHVTSNETIQGVQFQRTPEIGDVPLVCDASSDFLSRPLDIERYGLLYACAQKNAGAAGLTVVIVRDDLIAESHEGLASMLDYRSQADAGSRLNTPPVFAVYVFLLITRWLRKRASGLVSIAEANERKATTLYEVLDESDFYRGHAKLECRSRMNVTFRLAAEALEREFLAQSAKRGLCSLKGHRSVGGVRASIYNAMPLEGVEALRHFMLEFEKQHG